MQNETWLVVWRGDEDEYYQSEIEPFDIKNAPANEMVRRASISAGYSQETAEAMIESGYDLILVCTMPSRFIY
jgi:hypothetical protein